jgi:cytochrome c553
MLFRLWIVVLASCVFPAFTQAQAPPRDDSAAVEFFEKRIRPLLVGNCYTCHSADTNSKGGLRLDDRNGMLFGGNSGPAVVPGQPDKSLLIKKITLADAKTRMPLDKQLSDDQIADLTKWVKDGAAWPKVKIPASLGKTNAEYEKLRKEHWAWQPLTQPKVPEVKNASWPRSDIDRFILAKLEEKNLVQVSAADKATLIRRVTFDLTGLPPTLDEIDAFVNDSSKDAFAKVVDRLLASPAFGERWGRHWLDVARYGESTGSARNLPYPHAWRYRDYVIASFNRDKPYDQFIREQIAGDLLPAGSRQERDEHLVATGFLALGVKDVNQRFKVRYIMDNIDEQIDTMGRAILGLTTGCARCHDHKFDPIPTTDYYALAGIFHSTDNCSGLRNKMGGGGLDYYDNQMLLEVAATLPPDPKHAEKVEQVKKDLEKAKADWEKIKDTPEGLAKDDKGVPKQRPYRLNMEKLQKELARLTDVAGQGRAAMGVRDGKIIGDTEVRIRGEAEKIGPVVPRGFLSVVNVPGAPKINPKQSGRLELAQWLTSDKNPLTSRVMANRIWQHLFGEGLVSSVDNFGVTGTLPSNPELLDHLAHQFVREGWSVKKLVRALVMTRVYQLGSEAPSANVAVDPANRLNWRHSPRRLDAEEIRDTTLAVAGTLDRTPLQGSSAKDLEVIEMTNSGPVAKRIEGEGAKSLHRSVYLPLVRTLVPRALEVFDFAEQGLVTGSRDNTTVAPQALYLLNDPFVRKQSIVLAERLLKNSDLDDVGRIQLAYRLTLGRAATTREIDRIQKYLAEYEATAEALPPAPKKPAPKKQPAKKDQPEPKAKDPAPKKQPAKKGQPEPKVEEVVQPANPKVAAWSTFCQSLMASAEFRFVK